MHQLEKIGIFPPLMIIAGWNTHGGSWNETMVLFVEIRFFALKPRTQCIDQKKLGFSHPWFDVIVVTNFLMTQLLNKFANTVIPTTYFSSITFGIFCILTVL